VWITNPFFIQQMPFTGKFSIIDAWLTMAKEYNVLGYMDDSLWFDLGTPEKIAAAEKYLKQ
jgi:NDP-sugar pyrophosphorylase family protein